MAFPFLSAAYWHRYAFEQQGNATPRVIKSKI